MPELLIYMGAGALLVVGVASALVELPRAWRLGLAGLLAALAVATALVVASRRVHLGYLVITDGELMGRWFPGVWKAHLYAASVFLLAPVELALAAALALGRGRIAFGLGLGGVALALALGFTRLTWPLAVPAFL